nr:nuclear receptor-interacting protein 2 isoform X3 [Pelodiscus sinensis]|eukprot:XP_025040405.1 nuclear receptor-interacting protein 2 isoform X3 [Pelodiscus sinensis]
MATARASGPLTHHQNSEQHMLDSTEGLAGEGPAASGIPASLSAALVLPSPPLGFRDPTKQPHSVVQRRLLEGNLNKLRGESREYTTWVQSPLVKDKDNGAEKKQNDRRKEIVSLLIHCKCQGQVLRASVNTGCQQNLISMSCLKRLGLQEVSDADHGDLFLPVLSVVGQVECVEVQLGQETVVCSALIVEDEMLEFCFGLQTLLSLKCCIDLEEGVLRLKALNEELPFLNASDEHGQ